MNAKKYISILCLLYPVIGIADFNINFESTFGIYDPSGTTGILSELDDTATVQIIALGANNNYDSQLTWTLGDNPPDHSLSPIDGDDVLLWQGSVVNDNPSLFTQWAFGVYGTVQEPYLGNGYVIGRIWNQRTGWYYEGHIQQMADADLGPPPPVPVSYDLGQGLNNQTAIPEPSSAILIFLAGGLMYFKTRILGGR